VSAPRSVVVAEDHAMVRAGLVEIISGFPEFLTVAEAATGEEAIAAAAKHQPDAMVLDLDMPDTTDPRRSRAETAIDVLAASPRTNIVILTMHDDPETVRQLLRAGVKGFLSKTAGPDELRGALNASDRTDDNVFVEVPRRTMLGLTDTHPPNGHTLTPRELEVLAHVANGSSTRTLAREMHIAEATAKRHLDRIFKKLDANSRMSAVNRARELGVL
jgi:DNA-binding NarL/FixJ family response regulator